MTLDLQPAEWMAAATHALSAPAEVRSTGMQRCVFSGSNKACVQGGKTAMPASLESTKECERLKESFLSWPSSPR